MITAEMCHCPRNWEQHVVLLQAHTDPQFVAAWLTISAETHPGQMYRQQHVTMLKAGHDKEAADESACHTIYPNVLLHNEDLPHGFWPAAWFGHLGVSRRAISREPDATRSASHLEG